MAVWSGPQVWLALAWGPSSEIIADVVMQLRRPEGSIPHQRSTVILRRHWHLLTQPNSSHPAHTSVPSPPQPSQSVRSDPCFDNRVAEFCAALLDAIRDPFSSTVARAADLTSAGSGSNTGDDDQRVLAAFTQELSALLPSSTHEVRGYKYGSGQVITHCIVGCLCT